MLNSSNHLFGKSFFFSCFLLLLFFSTLEAQRIGDPFFTLTTEGYNDLTAAQQVEIDLLRDDEIIPYQSFATYYDLEDIQTNGTININHPISGELTSIRVQYTEFFEEGYYWRGQADTSISHTFAFTRYNDLTFGTLTFPDEVFYFESVGDGRLMIYQTEEEGLHCGDDTPSEGAIDPPQYLILSHHCDVDVIALFTEKFRKKLDGGSTKEEKTRAVIQSKVAETNFAIFISQLDGDFRFNLVGIKKSGFVEDKDKINKEKLLHFEPSSRSGEMYQARQSNDADISMLFTHGKYKNKNGKRIGGSSGSSRLEQNLAYVIIEKKGLKNRKKNTHTTAHELFHLCRALHHSTEDPLGVPYATSSLVSNPHWGPAVLTSLMTGGPLNGSRHIPLLSNPGILIGDEDFGIEDEKDNARVVSENICTVSAYASKQAPTGFELRISLLDHLPFCACGPNINLKAIPQSGGQSPYHFAWAYSTDGGFNYFGFGSDTDLQSFTPPCTPQDIVIRVIATDANGATATRKRTVSFEDPSECDDDPHGKKILEEETLMLYPNPAQDILFIKLADSFQEKPDQVMWLRLFSMTGQLIEEKEMDLTVAESIKSLNISKLPRGVYVVQLISGDIAYSGTFKKIER